ncbi:MAG: hypothetical protein R3C03_23960 [Pirellulaceae bacterium]
MSQWSKDFAGRGAEMLAGYFGNGTAAGRIIDLHKISNKFSHVVLGEEYSKTATGSYQEVLVFKRDAWAIINPTNPKYCGVPRIENGSKVIIDETDYTVEEAHKNGDIIDFRLVRRPPTEFTGQQDYRRQ